MKDSYPGVQTWTYHVQPLPSQFRHARTRKQISPCQKAFIVCVDLLRAINILILFLTFCKYRIRYILNYLYIVRLPNYQMSSSHAYIRVMTFELRPLPRKLDVEIDASLDVTRMKGQLSIMSCTMSIVAGFFRRSVPQYQCDNTNPKNCIIQK